MDYKELDTVVLDKDLPDHGLRQRHVSTTLRHSAFGFTEQSPPVLAV